MILRQATEADAQLLTEMRLTMRRERENAALNIDENVFAANIESYFKQALADGSYAGFIAEVDGAAAATGGICFHIHPPSYQVPNGKSACLLNMYTRPDFRGRGLAGILVKQLVACAKEKGCCKVFLNASDMGKPLYQKFGFKEVANEMVFDLIP